MPFTVGAVTPTETGVPTALKLRIPLAWLKLHPDDVVGAKKALEGFVSHLDEACIGSISEVFDAEPQFTSRGCIAQAWSVAEVLRSWVRVLP